MKINDPKALAGMTEAFERYERALMDNDPATLELLFWNSPLTLRYGVAENLYGWDEICAFRQKRANNGGAPQRRIVKRVLTTYGDDFGTATIEDGRDSGKSGRQSQTWMRTPEGWRVVAAHVSMLASADNDPGSKPRAS